MSFSVITALGNTFLCTNTEQHRILPDYGIILSTTQRIHEVAEHMKTNISSVENVIETASLYSQAIPAQNGNRQIMRIKQICEKAGGIVIC